jgi:hypothetical protein
MLAGKAALQFVDNVRPVLEEEKLGPARDAIHELFMEHVMAQAPGYDKLMSWAHAPIMPTPGAMGLIIQALAERDKVNVVGVDIGGATTDVFSVFDGVFNRTVSANLGMSYSISNVLAEAGIDNIRRWVPFELDPETRRIVTFAPLNLAGDGYPALVTNTAAVDVLLCRNVLMYFTREAQRATAERLRGALAPGGWLAVSPAEASADLFRPLAQVNLGAILYRKEPGGPPIPAARPATQAVSPRPSPEPLSLDSLPVSPPAPPTAAEARAAPDRAAQLARARALADQGELEPARTLCQALLSGDRLDPEAPLLLAAICQEQGETAAAMEALRRALFLAPDSPPAHFLMGSLLFQQGERRRARRAMETVVGLLTSVERDEVLAGSDGLTAGRLLETAQGYLDSR